MLNNSFVVMDFYTNGFKENALIVISLISIFFGVLVIISKNPIISVLFLISLFLCISFYLMLLGFNFLGISYLLVYIGAVSILFLFILMLINVRVSELLNETYNSILLSIIIAFSFNITISNIIPHNLYSFNISSEEKDRFTDLFDMKFKLNRDNNDNVTYISFES
jgi:NADH-ubiquinone oxidoreductase chain 6